MKKIILAGLGLGLLIGFTGSANATITGFQFSGTWNGGSNIDFLKVDDAFQGTVSYDIDQTPGSDPMLNIYSSNYFNLSTGSINASRRGDINIFHKNANPDQFGIRFDPLGTDSFDFGYIWLTATDSNVFADGSLPKDIADLGALPFKSCSLNLFTKDSPSYTPRLSTSTNLSITPLPTPEPSTYTLLATGLAALAGLRKITKSPLAEHKQG